VYLLTISNHLIIHRILSVAYRSDKLQSFACQPMLRVRDSHSNIGLRMKKAFHQTAKGYEQFQYLSKSII
jgi:hypothetical protein